MVVNYFQLKQSKVIYSRGRSHVAFKDISWKWDHFEWAKSILKTLLAQLYFSKGFRSFHTGNIRSVGQRAAKLPSVKLWEWFDPSTTRARADHACTRFSCKGRIGRLFLETSNFESWQLCSPLIYRFHTTCMERSKPLFKVGQEFKRLATF